MLYAYSEKYNYIINWSAKSGCTMFRRMFLELHKEELNIPPKHNWHCIEKDFPLPKNKNKNEIPNIYLVRNPYKRVVSMFTNKYCGGRGHSSLPDIFGLEKVTFKFFVLKLLQLKKENKLNNNDLHIREQSCGYEKNEKSYIIKLEEFNEEILNLYHKLNLNELSSKINKFINNPGEINKREICEEKELIYNKEYTVDQIIFPDYKYFYDQELLTLVFEIYKDDFLNFGYEKNVF